MSLDLGALVGSVILEDAQFQRTYPRVVRQFANLGGRAEQAAAGTATLDRSLAAAAKSANAATSALSRTQATTNRAVTSARDAAVAFIAASDGSAKLRSAELGVISAQERLNKLLVEGKAGTAQYASAQASLIRSEERLVTVRQQEAAAAEKAAAADKLTAREREAAAASNAAFLDRQSVAMARYTATAHGAQIAQEAASAATGRWKSSLAGLGRTAGELGLFIGGIEIAKKAAEFIGAGKELTDALNSVQAAAQATDEEMKPVRAQVIALGKDLRVPGATAVDAAHAIDDLVRAGMTLPRAMAAARSALLLASVANTDMAFSSRVLGDALDEFQLPASKAASTANMLGAAATSTAGGLETVFDALKYAGTRARAAEIPMDDLLAAIVDLSKAGLEGTMIGTGLAMAITKLAAPSGPGAKALKDLGIEAWDATGRFKGMTYVVSSVYEARKRFGADSQRFLADLSTVFGARAANAIAAFSGKGIEGLDRFRDRLNSFDLQKAADNMNRGVGAAFRQLSKEATAAGIDIYQGLEPGLASAVMWLGQKLPAAIQTVTNIVSPLAHEVGGVLSPAWHALGIVLGIVAGALGAVGNFLEDNRAIVTGLGTAVLVLWAAMKGFTILNAAAAAFSRFSARAAGAMSGLPARASSATASITPMTGAIGAAAVGLGILAIGWQQAQASEQRAAQRMKEIADGLAQSIEQDAGRVGKATEAFALKQIGDAGGLDFAKRFGVTMDDIVNAAEHGGKALENLRHLATSKVLDFGVGNSADFLQTLDDINKQLPKQIELYKAVQKANRDNQAAADGGAAAAAGQASALGLSTNAYLDAQQATAKNTEQTRQQTLAFQLENDAASLLQQALDGLAGVNLSVASAQTAVSSANLQVAASFKQNGKAIRGSSQAAVNNQQALQGQVQASQQLASAIGKRTHSTRAEIQSLKDSKSQLESQLRAQNQLTPAVQAYIDKLYNVKAVSDYLLKHPTQLDADSTPAQRKITTLEARIRAIKQGRVPGIDADTTAGRRKIAALQAQINSLRGKDIPINLSVSGRGVKGMHGTVQFALASGGTVPGQGNTDSVPAMLTPGEEVISKGPATKYRAILKAMNAGTVAGFASGGTVGRPPVETSITGGTGVGSITTDTVHGKKVWIYKGTRYASEMAALNAQERDRKKSNKEGLTDTATLPGVKGVAQAIAGQTGPAAKAMRLLSRAVNDAFDLKGVEKSIEQVKQKLADMKAYRSGVMGTLAGATDTTKAGSITDLLATLSGGTATNTAYTAEVTKLRAEAKGNKALTGFINQLAAQGQTTTLATLAGASKTDLAQVSKQIGAYNASLLAGGNAAVLTKYGTSVGAVSKQETQLEAERRADIEKIDKLLRAIALITGRPANISINGKVIAREVVHPEVIKILDELGNHLTYRRPHTKK